MEKKNCSSQLIVILICVYLAFVYKDKVLKYFNIEQYDVGNLKDAENDEGCKFSCIAKDNIAGPSAFAGGSVEGVIRPLIPKA